MAPAPTYTANGDPSRQTLDQLLNLLYSRKYRGSITIHFDQGRPLIAEYGRPSQVELVQKLNGAAAVSAGSGIPGSAARMVGGPEPSVVGRPTAEGAAGGSAGLAAGLPAEAGSEDPTAARGPA